MNDIFEIGKPVDKTWLHMEFDLSDTIKYSGDAVVENNEELDRLNKKYL